MHKLFYLLLLKITFTLSSLANDYQFIIDESKQKLSYETLQTQRYELHLAMLDDFEKTTKYKGKKKEEAKLFIENALSAYFQRGEHLSTAEMALRAEKLLEKKHADPIHSALLHQCHYYWSSLKNTYFYKGYDHAMKTFAQANKQKYSVYTQLLLNYFILDKSRNKKYLSRATDELLSNMKAILQNEKLDKRLRFTLIKTPLERVSKKNEAKTKKFIQEILQDPQIPKWLKKLCEGSFLIKAAWNARGSKWASETSREQFEQFAIKLKEAYSVLKEVAILDTNAPEATALLITTSAGLGNGERYKWFKGSVKREFDYSPAYWKYTNFILPRWGGSHNEMKRLAEVCLQTQRFDTAIPGLQFTVYENILKDYKGDYSKIDTKAHFKSIIDSLTPYLTKETYITYRDKVWIKKQIYSWAIITEQYELAKLYIKDLDPKLLPYFSKIDNDFSVNRVHKLILAMGGAHQELIKGVYHRHISPSLEVLQNKIELLSTDLAKITKALKSTVETFPEEQDYLKSLKKQLQEELDFSAGNPLSYTFNKELDQWRTIGAPFWQIDQNTMASSGWPVHRASLNQSLEPPYSIEMTIIGHGPYYGRTEELYTGVTLGSYAFDTDKNLNFWVSVRSPAYSVHNSHKKFVKNHYTPNHKNNRTIKVNAWKNYYEFFIDGKLVDIGLNVAFEPNKIYIGMPPKISTGGGYLQYKNIKIQKLNKKTALNTLEDKLNFLNSRNQELQEDQAFAYKSCEELLMAGKISEAEKHFNQHLKSSLDVKHMALRSEILIALKKYEQAERLIQLIKDRAPKPGFIKYIHKTPHQHIMLQYAKLLQAKILLQKDFEANQSQANQIIKQELKNSRKNIHPELHFLQAIIAKKNGNKAKTIEAYNKYIELEKSLSRQTHLHKQLFQ